MQRGLMLVGLGSVIGTLIALAATRYIESMLYGVRGDDPVTLGLAILILYIAASIACLLPARRAARIDPIIALRQ